MDKQSTSTSILPSLVIFDDTINSTSLSQLAHNNFVLEKGKFNSIYQYVYMQMVRAFGKSEASIRIRLRGCSTPVQFKTVLGGHFDDLIAKGMMTADDASDFMLKFGNMLLLDGYKAMFEQNPQAREELLATGNKLIVFADKDDRLCGVGMSRRDFQLWLQRSNMSRVMLQAMLNRPSNRRPCQLGRNLIGTILTDLREYFRRASFQSGSGASVGCPGDMQPSATATSGGKVRQRKRVLQRPLVTKRRLLKKKTTSTIQAEAATATSEPKRDEGEPGDVSTATQSIAEPVSAVATTEPMESTSAPPHEQPKEEEAKDNFDFSKLDLSSLVVRFDLSSGKRAAEEQRTDVQETEQPVVTVESETDNEAETIFLPDFEEEFTVIDSVGGSESEREDKAAVEIVPEKSASGVQVSTPFRSKPNLDLSSLVVRVSDTGRTAARATPAREADAAAEELENVVNPTKRMLAERRARREKTTHHLGRKSKTKQELSNSKAEMEVTDVNSAPSAEDEVEELLRLAALESMKKRVNLEEITSRVLVPGQLSEQPAVADPSMKKKKLKREKKNKALKLKSVVATHSAEQSTATGIADIFKEPDLPLHMTKQSPRVGIASTVAVASRVEIPSRKSRKARADSESRSTKRSRKNRAGSESRNARPQNQDLNADISSLSQTDVTALKALLEGVFQPKEIDELVDGAIASKKANQEPKDGTVVRRKKRKRHEQQMLGEVDALAAGGRRSRSRSSSKVMEVALLKHEKRIRYERRRATSSERREDIASVVKVVNHPTPRQLLPHNMRRPRDYRTPARRTTDRPAVVCSPPPSPPPAPPGLQGITRSPTRSPVREMSARNMCYYATYRADRWWSRPESPSSSSGSSRSPSPNPPYFAWRRSVSRATTPAESVCSMSVPRLDPLKTLASLESAMAENPDLEQFGAVAVSSVYSVLTDVVDAVCEKMKDRDELLQRFELNQKTVDRLRRMDIPKRRSKAKRSGSSSRKRLSEPPRDLDPAKRRRRSRDRDREVECQDSAGRFARALSIDRRRSGSTRLPSRARSMAVDMGDDRHVHAHSGRRYENYELEPGEVAPPWWRPKDELPPKPPEPKYEGLTLLQRLTLKQDREDPSLHDDVAKAATEAARVAAEKASLEDYRKNAALYEAQTIAAQALIPFFATPSVAIDVDALSVPERMRLWTTLERRRKKNKGNVNAQRYRAFLRRKLLPASLGGLGLDGLIYNNQLNEEALQQMIMKNRFGLNVQLSEGGELTYDMDNFMNQLTKMLPPPPTEEGGGTEDEDAPVLQKDIRQELGTLSKYGTPFDPLDMKVPVPLGGLFGSAQDDLDIDYDEFPFEPETTGPVPLFSSLVDMPTKKKKRKPRRSGGGGGVGFADGSQGGTHIPTKPKAPSFSSKAMEMRYHASRWKKGGALTSTGRYVEHDSTLETIVEEDEDEENTANRYGYGYDDETYKRLTTDWGGDNPDIPQPAQGVFEKGVVFEDTSKYVDFLDWYQETHAPRTSSFEEEDARYFELRQFFQRYREDMAYDLAERLQERIKAVLRDERHVARLEEKPPAALPPPPGVEEVKNPEVEEPRTAADALKITSKQLGLEPGYALSRTGFTRDGGVSFEGKPVRYVPVDRAKLDDDLSNM